MKHLARVCLVGPVTGSRGCGGGVERYGAWLEAAWSDRLDPHGVRFALKARLGGEVVRTGDGVSAEWVRACGRSRIRWARHVGRERRAVRAARRVVATSPMVADELMRCYGRRDAVVILNPLLVPPAVPESDAAGSLVFVGHGFHRKGLDHLLAVVAQVGLPLQVLGADQRLEGWRRRAPAGVVFHGPVEAGPWIAGAAAVVHPARYEPYGNVVAEAVAAGTPVVASDGCGAACLLDQRHVWGRETGVKGLLAVVRGALDNPRDPRRHPPSAAAHLEALEGVLV